MHFLLLDPSGTRILVADEIIRKGQYTKFPGGGLEWGEGPEECALREAREELGQEVELTGHFYTTGFFVQSAFRDTDQILSIYYTARLREPQRFITHAERFSFRQAVDPEEAFRWVEADHLDPSDFHFPIDREVVRRLRENWPVRKDQ